MPSRGITPVVGVVILLLVTLGLSGALAVVIADSQPTVEPQSFSFSINATHEEEHGGTIELFHEGGATVYTGDIDLWVEIDGTPLKVQPDVPYSSNGLSGMAKGPFNWNSADKNWGAGEYGSFNIAKSANEPHIEVGSEVTVKIYHEDVLVASATAIASG